MAEQHQASSAGQPGDDQEQPTQVQEEQPPHDSSQVDNEDSLPVSLAQNQTLMEQEGPQTSSKRRCLLKGVLVLSVLLLLVLIGVVTDVFMDKKNDMGDEDAATAVSSSTWDPKTRLYEIKSALSRVSDPSRFLEPVSHQTRALDWLVYQDTVLQSVDDSNLLQRYALILFAFATNAELWRAVEPWYEFPNFHECDDSFFVGIDCNKDHEVVAIDMFLRKLSGTLPEELGLLTELTSLQLSRNFLEGPIPESVYSKLTKLGKKVAL
jgi:hypothetical protein